MKKSMLTMLILLCLLAPPAWAQSTMDGVTLTVYSRGAFAAPNDIVAPQPGNKLYAVEVSIQNSSRKAVSYNPYDFTLQDGKGYVYQPACGKEPPLNSGTLEAGRMIRGHITWELPAGAVLKL